MQNSYTASGSISKLAFLEDPASENLLSTGRLIVVRPYPSTASELFLDPRGPRHETRRPVGQVVCTALEAAQPGFHVLQNRQEPLSRRQLTE
jgi:hypothetical protein